MSENRATRRTAKAKLKTDCCGNCRFYLAGAPNVTPGAGLCRERPPQNTPKGFDGAYTTNFPALMPTDWCGRHAK